MMRIIIVIAIINTLICMRLERDIVQSMKETQDRHDEKIWLITKIVARLIIWVTAIPTYINRIIKLKQL